LLQDLQVAGWRHHLHRDSRIQRLHQLWTWGGTSFDAALHQKSNTLVTTEGEINRSGWSPMLNIVTIGAGGGSMADREGGLAEDGPQRRRGQVQGPLLQSGGRGIPHLHGLRSGPRYVDKDYFAGGKLLSQIEERSRPSDQNPHCDKLARMSLEAAAGMYHVIT